MTLQNAIEFAATLGAGTLLAKIFDWFRLPKKEQKEFDNQLRDELWDRIKNLEGRLDEQNKNIMEAMKENAELKFQLQQVINENSALKKENELLRKVQ